MLKICDYILLVKLLKKKKKENNFCFSTEKFLISNKSHTHTDGAKDFIRIFYTVMFLNKINTFLNISFVNETMTKKNGNH